MSRHINKHSNNPINENWIRTENLKAWKHDAAGQLEKQKAFESMFDVVWEPHPTLRNTIRKLIPKK